MEIISSTSFSCNRRRPGSEPPDFGHNTRMPLFDFRCRSCGNEFEGLVRAGGEPACPACASADLERLLSGFSFSVRSGGLSSAARRAVQKQQHAQRRDQAAFQEEIEKKHLDD